MPKNFIADLKNSAEKMIIENTNAALSASEIIADKSSDIALEKAIRMLEATETKILAAHINGVQISVGICLGPISINITKNITPEQSE